MLELLSQNPVQFFALLFAMVFSLAFHEFSHALVATRLGDETARRMGRLTINPLAHIDPIGLALFLFVGFGWGKPVPFDATSLKYRKFGPAFVGLAGPMANLLLAVTFGIIIKLLLAYSSVGYENMAVQFLADVVIINALWMTFNLIPIPPLDGSKVLFAFLPDSLDHIKLQLERLGPLFLLGILLLDQTIGLSFFSRLFNFVLTGVARLIT